MMQDLIHRIAVPNPFFEGHNSVYLVKCDPLTLIDTGVATDEAFDHLKGGLDSLGVSVSDIERVILTHKHIDHIGNAFRIQQASNAKIVIHELETKSLVDVDPSGNRFADLVHQRMSDWGVPETAQEETTETKMPAWKLEACKPTEMKHGDQLESDAGPFEVIHTPGHTMGSVCIRFGDAIFTGDHVLQVISPNIGGGDLRSRGMLAHFLNSLNEIKPHEELRAYPGHGDSFVGLKDRIEKLTRHHERRLTKTKNAVLGETKTVYEVATTIFRRLHGFHIMLGCAEANAHLEFLVDKNEVCETDGRFTAVLDD